MLPMNPVPPLRRLPLALALATALPLAAHADPAIQSHDHAPVDLDAVEVKATPLADDAEHLMRPVDVLAGEKLDDAKANSLGETVAKLPGVQSSYFGPGVGRPTIRGLDGARVQVLSDGLGTGDVSTVSVDHAVSVEPFLAEQIEVLKGPATLLYGSGAIGGAVNVVDGRVPERTTAEPLQGRAELRGGTVNDEKTGMVRLDGTSSDGHWVFHVDALHRETGDYDIPGHAESEHAHEDEHHDDDDHDHDEHEEEGAFGTLPNSAIRTDAGAFGLSWVGERGFLGASASLYNTRYGVPGHSHGEEEDHDHGHDDDDHDDDHDHDEAHAHEEGVTIVMDQRRYEVRGGLDDIGPFASLKAKMAHTDYTHTEYEGDEVGTVFHSTSTEARLEALHSPIAGWDGAFGLQWAQRDFEAIGDEAFVPGSETRDVGLFWIGQRDFDPIRVELGARYDRNSIRVDGATRLVDNAEVAFPDNDFDTFSASAALRWDISDDFHLSFGLDRAQRSPVAEELYSSGLHVATGSVELGDPTLDVETANRAEIGLHWHSGPFKLGASLYQARFDDFIYLADTGVDDGGPVYLWTQEDARFTGGEVEGTWTFAENASGLWDLTVFGDIVDAELTGSGTRDVDISVPHGDHSHDYTVTLERSGALPRIAPARVGGSLDWSLGAWRVSLGAIRYMEQDDVAANETSTPGYTLVDAHLAWHIDTASGGSWEVFVDGSNLLDEEARVHTSFLKDLAPLPGRGFAFGVRSYF